MKFKIVTGYYGSDVEREVNRRLQEGWDILSTGFAKSQYSETHVVYMVKHDD